MRSFKNLLTFFIFSMLLAITGCEKIPVGQEKEKNTFNIIPTSTYVELFYGVLTDVPCSIQNADGLISMVETRGIPNDETIKLEFINQTRTIRILSTNPTDIEFKLAIVFENANGKKEIELDVRTIGNERINIKDDETRTSYDLPEYPSFLEFNLDKKYDKLEIELDKNSQKWLDAELIEDQKIKIVSRKNNSDTTRIASLSLKRGPNSTTIIKFNQIGSLQPGSLTYGLLKLKEAHPNMVENSGDKIKNWNVSNDLNNWQCITNKNIPTSVKAFGTTCSVFSATEHTWEINIILLDENDIPVEFLDVIKYFTHIEFWNGAEHPIKTDFDWNPNVEFIQGLMFENINFNVLDNCQNLKYVLGMSGELTEEFVNKHPLLESFICYLSGTIPLNIGNLKYLKEFTALNSNEKHSTITGPLPDSFYKLENLEVFDVSARLNGKISTKIKNLKNLRQFYIGAYDGDNNFQSGIEGPVPEEFGMLENLWMLDFSGNFIEEIPEFLRYRSIYWHEWATAMCDLPFCQYRKSDKKHIVLACPKWYYERYGVYGEINPKSKLEYPYAVDLEYPATEYYYDGKDWRHPNYEHPARFYHKINGIWTYDPDWNWNELIEGSERIIE